MRYLKQFVVHKQHNLNYQSKLYCSRIYTNDVHKNSFIELPILSQKSF